MSRHSALPPSTASQGMLYGLPLLSLYFLFGPIAVLQGIYAKHFGLALTTIAAVLFIARLFDAVSDLLIGYYADRYYARRATRKPFILCGGVLFIIASWFLYVPPAQVSSAYFLFWFLAFYFSFTLVEIPHLAWGSALATDARAKNTIFTWRALFASAGGLLFYVVPLLPWFATSEITPQTLKWSVLVAGALMLPLLLLCVYRLPDRQIASPVRQPDAGESLWQALTTIFANKPLLILTAAHICTGFGAGMWFTLYFIFVDAYLGLGGYFAGVYAASMVLGMVLLRLWHRLAQHWDKQWVWAASMLLAILGLIGTGLLAPGRTGWFTLLLCSGLITVSFIAFSAMVPSLLSDIVDYGTWKFGRDRAGSYFALYTFINKTVAALGGALSLALAGWLGFDAGATEHSETAIFGLRLAVAWIPVIFVLLSIGFILRIPITARRHAIVRKRLDARAIRGQTSNTQTQKKPLNPECLIQKTST